jgi:hypothetical protein
MVEDPSGARKWGPNRLLEWAGPAGLGRPAQSHFGLVRSPLRFRGSSGDFDDVNLASKMEVLRA